MSLGSYEGTVITEWVTPDREMKLLSDFAYRDPESYLWHAPRGSIIDGASIPRVFWTVIGSPFTGHYRNASVVHDVACHRRREPWRAVHRMFYWACRCGGVPTLKAKLMFAAVHHFGPRWGMDGVLELEPAPPGMEDVTRLQDFIEREDPPLEAIEALSVR